MKNLYSKKFLDLAMEKVLNLYPSNVIRWKFRPPFLEDIRKVFVQTEEEDKILTDYYYKFVKDKKTIMEKAKALAIAVNSRIKYQPDIEVYKNIEYWVSPMQVHNKRIDDCDGYAVLLCYLIRLFGAAPWEVFVRAGDAVHPDGRIEGHANVLVLDINKMTFYYLEGSFYPDRSLRQFGLLSAIDNLSYKNTWFITNDLISYSHTPWIKFVH